MDFRQILFWAFFVSAVMSAVAGESHIWNNPTASVRLDGRDKFYLGNCHRGLCLMPLVGKSVLIVGVHHNVAEQPTFGDGPNLITAIPAACLRGRMWTNELRSFCWVANSLIQYRPRLLQNFCRLSAFHKECEIFSAGVSTIGYSDNDADGFNFCGGLTNRIHNASYGEFFGPNVEGNRSGLKIKRNKCSLTDDIISRYQMSLVSLNTGVSQDSEQSKKGNFVSWLLPIFLYGFCLIGFYHGFPRPTTAVGLSLILVASIIWILTTVFVTSERRVGKGA